MFEVVEISLATTDRLFKYKRKYPELKGFGLKAFGHGWILESRSWSAGERVLDVGGAYSWVPSYLQSKFNCDVWVVDDFGVTVDESFWLRYGSPDEFVAAHPELRFVRERVGNPALSSLPEEYFDVVYSVSTMEHVPNELTPAVWQHMARLVKPGGDLIHAIDLSFPSNGGPKRILKSIALDSFGFLLPQSVRKKYLKATPKNYLSFILTSLDMADRSRPELDALRMSLDPEVVAESYSHGLNRILKDNENYRYRRIGSLLVHLRARSV
jgi:SAM-dependent methyltransferase